MLPEKIIHHKKSALVEIVYADNVFHIAASYLRLKSPSADNKSNGMGPSSPVSDFISHDKTSITDISNVGSYALQISFSDGHKSGIYSWDYIRILCISYKKEMAQIQKINKMSKQNEAKREDIQILKIQQASSSSTTKN